MSEHYNYWVKKKFQKSPLQPACIASFRNTLCLKRHSLLIKDKQRKLVLYLSFCVKFISLPQSAVRHSVKVFSILSDVKKLLISDWSLLPELCVCGMLIVIRLLCKFPFDKGWPFPFFQHANIPPRNTFRSHKFPFSFILGKKKVIDNHAFYGKKNTLYAWMALEILEQYASQCYVCKTIGFKGHTANKRLHRYANERHMTPRIAKIIIAYHRYAVRSFYASSTLEA